MLLRKSTVSLAALLVFALLVSGCFGLSNIAPADSGRGGPDIPRTPNFPGDNFTDRDLAAHAPGEIIVGVDSQARAREVASLLDAQLKGYLEPIGAALLQLGDETASLTDVMRSLKGKPGVRYAQANFTDYTLPYVKGESITETDFAADPRGDGTDVGLLDYDGSSQTWFERFQYGPRITKATEAWNNGITGKGRVIAVIDTGVDPTHPDLLGKVLPGFNPDYAREGGDPHDTDDFHDHGTHVAATAAGRKNVDSGERMTIGIAYDALVLPLRVFNPTETGYTSSTYGIAYALIVAADPALAGLDVPRADVANMSLGGPVYSQAIQDAVNFAVDRGVVVVASMGNSSNQEVSYPAAYQRVVAVAATNARDEVTDFSTTGPHTSVGAPGEFVFAAVPGGWAWMSGTSMAAPHVSGAVALMREQNSSVTPAQIKDVLQRTADSPGRFTRELGHGRINIARALDFDEPTVEHGSIEVFVHDGWEPVREANVVLYRNGKQLRTVRTGGAWAIGDVGLYDGVASFYELESGGGYSVAVSLDETLHGRSELKVVDDIDVDPGEVKRITVYFDP